MGGMCDDSPIVPAPLTGILHGLLMVNTLRSRLGKMGMGTMKSA